jgi:nucleoside-diphosphate-sugar epimerase
MKVLLIGATGNLGLRLVAALLTHGHVVVAYVRSVTKLESVLPASVYSQITVVEGNATDSSLIKQTILDHDCDAAINCAGLAAMAPWSKSDLPEIFAAVLKGVQQAGTQKSRPLRAWFLGGMGALNFPGTDNMLSD